MLICIYSPEDRHGNETHHCIPVWLLDCQYSVNNFRSNSYTL